jgi:ankyrin repeat protein
VIRVLIDVARISPSESPDSNGTPPLHLAADKDAEMVRVLLERGADPNELAIYRYDRTETKRTPLHICAHHSSSSWTGNESHEDTMKSKMLVIAKVLHEFGAKIGRPDSNGVTPLMEAATSNRPNPAVHWLLQNRASIPATENNGYTVLHHCRTDDAVETVLLVGLDVNSRGNQGRNALMKRGCAMPSLIAAGIDVNAGDNDGKTAVFYCSRSSSEKLKGLIDAGVHVNILDNEGKNVLRYFAETWFFENNGSPFPPLIEAGVDINAQDNQGRTALHILGPGFDEWPLYQLVSAKADVSIRDNYGRMALHNICAELSHLPMNENYSPIQNKANMAQKLLDSSADMNATGLEGNTPLHNAASSNFVANKVFEVLAKSGADPMARDHKGRTPLHRACQNSYRFEDARDPCGHIWYQDTQRHVLDFLKTFSGSRLDVNVL